jgi:D-alanyl-D-alanine dipeptidase
MSLFPRTALLVVFALAGCRSMPPPLGLDPVDRQSVASRAKSHGLVAVDTFDPAIRTDLRYATPDNAFKKVLYPPGFPALLADDTARKLAAANRTLQPHGLRLLVLDAYRPPEVQWQLYQMFRDDQYVADPRKKWSKHCYGRAVDVTLTDLSGRELEMPSAFDDFSSRAAAHYAGKDPAVRRRLTLLQEAMMSAGFSLYAGEWWHFNDLSDPAALTGRPVFGRDLGRGEPSRAAP